MKEKTPLVLSKKFCGVLAAAFGAAITVCMFTIGVNCGEVSGRRYANETWRNLIDGILKEKSGEENPEEKEV